MASAVELATAYVTVAASGDDLAPSLGRSFRQVEKVAGESGKRMGKALTGQVAKATKVDVDQAEAAYEQASKQVTSTAERQAVKVESARRKEEIAQAKVTEALQKYDAESSQVLAAQDRLALASQKVEAAQREQESATERANKKLAETKAALDDAKRAADDAEQPFMTLGDRIQSALKGDFKGAFDGVGRESKNAADGVVEDFDDAGDDAGSGMLDGLKGVLLTGGAALGIGASFGELFQQGIESVSSTAKLKASLGLSDADAQTLGKDAASAYAAGFGDDLATATDATAAVRQYLGPDVDTQWATEMSLAMAEAFGNDPQDNIKAVSQMIRTGMVEDAQEGFDVLTRGFQTGANKADDLTDTMTEYGTLFRNLGIDGATSVGLMTQGLNAGARDADKVADAFKEFSIRAVDGSEGTAAAFEALGLDADSMAQRIGAGGESARDATQEVLDKLGGVEDPALRAQIAVGLFGTQAEDLGDALYALDIDTASTGMGEIAGATEKMSDALAEAQSPFDRIKRSFSDIGTSLGSGMMPALNVFADTVISVGEFFRANPAVFTVLATGLTVAAGAAFLASTASTALFTSISTGIKSVPVIGWVIAGITLLVAALTWFFTKTETGQEIWAKVWGGIKNVFQGVMDWFTGTVMPLFQTIWGVLFEGDFKGGSALSEDSPVVSALFAIRDAALAVGTWVKDTLVPWLVGAWQVISDGAVWLWQNAIVPAWDGISAAIGATVDWLVNTAWPFIKGVWDAIAGAAIWLWQTIIQPVWNGIKLAIGIAVTAILVYIDLLKWYWNSVLAPVALWLWNSVIKPVWEGIQTAIGAVVNWFRDTAWPILKGVIDWIAGAFNTMRDGLQMAWFQIRTHIINPVIVWFLTTAWPVIDTVLGYLKTGFNVMRDSLKTAWNFIRDNVIDPVASWFRDTIGPLFDTVTGNISSAFGSMKEGIKKAWDAIKDAARTPARFVVEDVYNETLRATFNGVADKLDLPAKWRLPLGTVGFATGGIMPGYTPGRDVHTFYSPTAGVLELSGGEPILRPEAGRVLGAGWVHGINAAARAGGTEGVRSFLGGHQAFAGGGIWESIKNIGGDTWDWITDKASAITEAISDPFGVLTKLAGKVTELIPGGGMVHAATVQMGKNAGEMLGDWLQGQLSPVIVDGTGPVVGGTGGSLGAAERLATSMGLQITSRGRRGARTAGSGSVSLHALGRAIDVAAPMTTAGKALMMSYFTAAESRWGRSLTELLYTPAGARNIHRGGGRYPNSGATARNHYNHVHVGFADGGIFDTGGVLESGAFALNLSGRPEVVLNPAESRAYMAGQASAGIERGPLVQTGDIYGLSAEDVAAQIEIKRRRREALYER